MHLAWTDGSSHAHWPWKSPARLALRALTRGCSPSTLTSCIHLPVPLCSTPITALLSSYEDCDSSASLLPDRGLPASRHTSFRDHSASKHPTPPIVAFTRYPSARWVSPHGVQASPLACRLAGFVRPNQVRQPADWSLTSGCSPPRLAATQLPSASRPESVCLERTCTSIRVRSRAH